MAYYVDPELNGGNVSFKADSWRNDSVGEFLYVPFLFLEIRGDQFEPVVGADHYMSRDFSESNTCQKHYTLELMGVATA